MTRKEPFINNPLWESNQFEIIKNPLYKYTSNNYTRKL